MALAPLLIDGRPLDGRNMAAGGNLGISRPPVSAAHP